MQWLKAPLLITVFLCVTKAHLFNHDEALGMACALAARELFSACKEEDYECFCEDSLYVYSVENCIGREAQYNSTTMGTAYDKFVYSFCESHGTFVNTTDVWSAENQAQNPEVTDKSFKLAYDGERNSMSQKTISAWLGVGMILYWATLIVVTTACEWIRRFILRLVQYRVVMRRPPKIERALQKYILLPALFGMRHMRRYEYLKGWIVFTTPTRFESIVVSGYILLGLIFMLTPYTFMDNDPLFPTRWKEMMRYSSDRAGIIATVQFPLLILFALRNNIFIWLTGWSYSTFNTYHRAVARITYLLLIIHAILKHIFSASYGGSLVKYYYPVPYFRWGCAAIGLFTLMIMSAVFRARGYEVFYRLHQALAIGGLICSHYHLNGLGFKVPLWISFAFWGTDWLLRVLRILLFNVNFILPPLPGARQTTFATMRLYDGGLIRLSIVTPVRWEYTAGQYVFLHTKQFSFIGGHPFSVLGPNEYNEGLELVIKARDGMTRKLCTQLSERGCTPEYPITLPVYVEGPYGASAPVERYEEGLFFAGGIGITGVLGYMEKMVAANKRGTYPRKISLFWAIRQRSDIKPVLHVLTRLVNAEGVQIHIFLRQRQVQPVLSKVHEMSEKTPTGSETPDENESSIVESSDMERSLEQQPPHSDLGTDLGSYRHSTVPAARRMSQQQPKRASMIPRRLSSLPQFLSPDFESGREVEVEGEGQPESYNAEEAYNQRFKRNSYRHSMFAPHNRKSIIGHSRTKSDIKNLRHSVVNFVKARNPEDEEEDEGDYGRKNFENNLRKEDEAPMVSSALDIGLRAETHDEEEARELDRESKTPIARHERAQFVDAGFTDIPNRRMTMLNPFDDGSYPVYELTHRMTSIPTSNVEAETFIYNSIEPTGMDIVSIIREHFIRAEGSICIVGCGPDRMVDTLGWATWKFLELAEYGRVDYFEEAFKW